MYRHWCNQQYELAAPLEYGSGSLFGHLPAGCPDLHEDDAVVT